MNNPREVAINKIIYLSTSWSPRISNWEYMYTIPARARRILIPFGCEPFNSVLYGRFAKRTKVARDRLYGHFCNKHNRHDGGRRERAYCYINIPTHGLFAWRTGVSAETAIYIMLCIMRQ